MAKYNLNSKSDMRRFQKDLTKAIINEAANQKIDINCPKCNRKIKVKAGRNTCPHCHEEINVTLE